MNALRRLQLARLARGDRFTLGTNDERSWVVERHEMVDGVQRTRVRREHEDHTPRTQTPPSSLMVFQIEELPVESIMDPDPLGLDEERAAAIERMEARGEPTEAPRGSDDPRMIPLGDGGYLKGKAPTEGQNDG